MPAKRGYKIDLSSSSGIAFPDAAKPKFSGAERTELGVKEEECLCRVGRDSGDPEG